MTIQPLQLATATSAMAVGLFACTTLMDDLDGADIRPLPDPVVHQDVEVRDQAPKPRPNRRPARSFELGVSTRADVRAWSGGGGLTCESVALGRRWTCKGSSQTIVARFDRRGRLIGMEIKRWLDPDEAEARYADTTEQLEELVGPTTSEVRSDRFVRTAYERSERHFGYRGYEATVTATHFGHRGLQLRERYRLTPDGASTAL